MWHAVEVGLPGHHCCMPPPSFLLPIMLAVLLAACGRPDAPAPRNGPGADSTRFILALDSARSFLAEGNDTSAEAAVHYILKEAGAAGLHKPRAMALGVLGNIMQRRNRLDSAAVCHRMVIALAQEQGLTDVESTARINLGVVLELSGDPAGALEQQLEALRLKEQLGDSTGMARTLNNVGMLYARTNDTLKARDHFKRAIAINQQVAMGRPTGDSASWHRSLMNLAVVEMDLGRYDTALALLQRSGEVCPLRMYNRNIPALLTNKALAHEGLGNLDQARDHYEQALAMARQQGDEWSLGELRHYLADLLVRTGQPGLALAHLDSALQITRELGDRRSEQDVLLSRARTLAAMGRHKEAYEAHVAYAAVADSLMNAGKDAVMRELHVRYGVEKKENENQRLLADAQLAEARGQKLRWMLVAALLMAVAVGLASWLVMQRARERTRLREAQLEQQALRAQMDPHFLFNALNTIPGLYAETDPRTAAAYVGHLSNLLRLILESSRQVSVPLRQELDLITHYLHVSAARYPGAFEYAVAMQPDVDPDAVEMLPMLLQPLVENAIVHGLVPKRGGGHLQVNISRRDGLLECTVQDNGVGRRVGAAFGEGQAHPSRGLQIITERLRHFNRGGGNFAALEIVDLEDGEGGAAGTQVTVRTVMNSVWA